MGIDPLVYEIAGVIVGAAFILLILRLVLFREIKAWLDEIRRL